MSRVIKVDPVTYYALEGRIELFKTLAFNGTKTPYWFVFKNYYN